MRINYIRQVQAFNDRLLSNPLSSGQIALWHALMHINNKCAWVEWFTAANLSLEALCGLSRQGINKARNVLKQEGLIEFKSNGTKATSYKIIVLNNSTTSDSVQDSVQNSIQGGLQASVQTSVQNSSTLNKQNKTKLKETIDDDIGIFEFVQLNWREQPRGLLQGAIVNWIKTIGAPMTLFAFRVALENKVELRGLNAYVAKIVDTWNSNGIDTLEKAVESNNAFKERVSKSKFHRYQQVSQKVEEMPNWDAHKQSKLSPDQQTELAELEKMFND